MQAYVRRDFQEAVHKQGIFEIYSKALAMERDGRSIIHMEIGRPDFDTPASIKQAGIDAITAGHVHYTEPQGLLALRQAIVESVQRKQGLLYGPEECLVTIGASEALDLIWRSLLNPEDEVIVPGPYYPAYGYQLDFLGRRYHGLPVITGQADIRYQLEAFEKVVTPACKLLVINSPGNPSGHVMEEAELVAMADFAKRHDLLVLSDECYDHFVYEGVHQSIAGLPGMKERSLIVNSTSKTYAMTGWRVGYVLADQALIHAMCQIHAETTVCPAAFAQLAAAQAYREDPPELAEMQAAFAERREVILSAFQEIKGFDFVHPKGAFYLFVKLSGLGMDGDQFAARLLDEAGVAVSPGSCFGAAYQNYLRFSYACSMEELREALGRVKNFVARL